jgi:hypothetical protein
MPPQDNYPSTSVDDEERRRLAIGLAQTIAMRALELPAERGFAFVARAPR